jgi:hypothetical protein
VLTVDRPELLYGSYLVDHITALSRERMARLRNALRVRTGCEWASAVAASAN